MVNDEIREMARRFVDALHPVKIILFGSYAKNTYRDDSDYDFYIIMPDDTEWNMFNAAAEAYNSLNDMYERKSVDIIANTKSRFDARKIQPTMERIADREGVVLYECHGKHRNNFCSFHFKNSLCFYLQPMRAELLF